MYSTHRCFNTKNIQERPLWRYMEFWKFLSLVTGNQLYFSSMQLLGDLYEGKIPESVSSYLKQHNKELLEGLNHINESEMLNKTFISSWSVKNDENFFMWKIYAKNKFGIAIKTSFEGLTQSFKNYNPRVYIGEVIYDNKPTPYILSNFYNLYIIKKEFYSDEEEIRCVTSVANDNNINGHLLVDVDLNWLIEEVYITKFAYENGLKDLLEMVKEKYNLKFNIVKSKLKDNWL
jgi:hypothetical protein